MISLLDMTNPGGRYFTDLKDGQPINDMPVKVLYTEEDIVIYKRRVTVYRTPIEHFLKIFAPATEKQILLYRKHVEHDIDTI
jgi:hypothetical protein